MAIAVTDTYDWSDIYGSVQKAALIPGVQRISQQGFQLTYRDMLVKLDDVIAAVASAKTPPTFVFVDADVVVLPEARNWALDNVALVIAARRIEATAGTFFQLDYRASNNATVVIYATEIKGPLQVRAFTPSSATPTVYDLSQFSPLGVQIRKDGTQSSRNDLTSIDDSLLSFGSELWISLSSVFLFASALPAAQQDVASGMLRWVKAATAPSANARDLYLQSSAFLTQLTLSTSSVRFVPALSKTVYQQVASAFEDAAEQYETQYNLFMQQSGDVQQWISAAANMQKYFGLTDPFNASLLDQAAQNAKAAQEAMSQSTIRFTIQKNRVEQLRPIFEAGIEIWKSDQALKAVFSILSALVQFAGAVAIMAVGDEAAAPAAGAAAADAANAASAAAKAGGDAAKLAGSMSQLADAMKALKQVAEALEKVCGFVEKVVQASEDLSKATEINDVDIPSYSDVSAQAEWDVFRLHVDNMMKFAVDNGVEGAQDYNEALDDLAIYGKALTATQASFVQVAQELARIRMQSQISKTMTQTLSGYVAELQQQKTRDERMMFLVYLRQSSIKRWLFIAIQNYVSAFQYWALRDSNVVPSAIAPVADLRSDLAQMEQEYADALESFNPPPQNLQGVVVDVDDATLLHELQTTSAARIVVPLANQAFMGFGRVRLNCVRVWLEGVPATSQVYLELTASGTYDDRLSGKTYRFTSIPVERSFEYKGAFGDPAGIIVDGIVADEEKYAYFQPTPFTEWMVRVPADKNPGVQLGAVTKIRLFFAGSVIGAQPRVAKIARKVGVGKEVAAVVEAT